MCSYIEYPSDNCFPSSKYIFLFQKCPSLLLLGSMPSRERFHSKIERGDDTLLHSSQVSSLEQKMDFTYYRKLVY